MTRHGKTSPSNNETELTSQSEKLKKNTQIFELPVESNVLRKTLVREYPYGGFTEETDLGKYCDKQLMIAWDSEWDNEGTQHNRILSYQVAVLKSRKLYTQILYPKPGARLIFSEIIAASLAMTAEVGLLPEGVPSDVLLFGHWTTADLRALGDFKALKIVTDGLRGSFVSLKKPVEVQCIDKKRKSVSVHIRDTKLLAPGVKQSLEALGDMISIPKVKLPEGAISNMAKLMEQDLPLFESYAERDPVVTVLYARMLIDKLSDYCVPGGFPTTLGGVAQDACVMSLTEANVDWLDLFGYDLVEVTNYTRGRYITKKVEVLKPLVHLNEQFATESYHGGRNETYQYGASDITEWSDYDLSSAYTTSLATLGKPEWERLFHTTNVDDFGSETLGFALVDFKFPRKVRFPCIPVRTERGLICPLSGRSFCTASELFVARTLGAEVQIVDGIVIPCAAAKPFEVVFTKLFSKRRSYRKGTLGNLLFKELGNSIYGKTAQGLKRKRVFDTRDGIRKPIPPSKITNPYIAAYTSGFTRAALAEVLNGLPAGRQVISATTDGFITDADEAEMRTACQGPCAQLFLNTVSRLSCENLLLPVEVKHEAKQILAWRRRGQATLQAGEGSLILAKAGLKAPTQDTAEQNRWIIENFKTRKYDTTFWYSHLPTLYELYSDEERDLVRYEKERRLNMDFDFCRKPTGLETRTVDGVSHVFFTSVPWTTAEEAVRASKDWADFSATRGVAMREEQDLREFLERLQVERRPARKRAQPIKVAIRTFLQALMGNHFGLTQSFDRKRNQKLSDWLNRHGYKVTVSDVENAKRDAVPELHWVPRTPETLKFVEVIKLRWPSFQDREFFTLDAEI